MVWGILGKRFQGRRWVSVLINNKMKTLISRNIVENAGGVYYKQGAVREGWSSDNLFIR